MRHEPLAYTVPRPAAKSEYAASLQWLSMTLHAIGIDVVHELLESRLRSQHVEIRFHHHVDQGGAATERAGLEQRKRLLLIPNLRVTPGCRHERPALLEHLSTLAQDRLEAAALKSSRDGLSSFRGGCSLP
jgi:hypothetical protein